jgi:hypothetical protein
MRVTVSFYYPNVKVDSPRATTILETYFDKYDLRRIEEDFNCSQVVLEDVVED